MARDTERRGGPPPPPEPLPVEVVDSHCHLDLMGQRRRDHGVAAPPEADIPGSPGQRRRDHGAAAPPEAEVPGSPGTATAEALAAAASVGVTRVVTVGIDLETSRWQAMVATEYPQVFAAVAIHPNEAAHGVPDDVFDEIARLASLPSVRAVGETGLDYFRTPPPAHAAQQESFRRHIDIAKRTGRTLMIHDRDAHEDTLRILAEEGAPERVVFHAFSGDEAMVKTCADAGYLMSFAGNVTFRNAVGLREAAAAVPAEALLVETDAPFLTPEPFRGRPNGPHLVPLTVRALAAARGQDVATVAAAIAANAERAFGPW